MFIKRLKKKKIVIVNLKIMFKNLHIYYFILNMSILTMFAQKNDSLLFKKNFVYFSSFPWTSDVLELNDYWVSIGYDRIYNKKIIFGINIGSIVYSQPSTGAFYGPGLGATKSVGFRLNVEAKYIFWKKWYSSINLFNQNTISTLKETIVENQSVNQHTYYVYRYAYSFIPKIGVYLKKDKKNFYTDLSLGFGIKYISSNTKFKISQNSNQTESYSGKEFESGTIFTYHPLFHIKIGYNF